MACQQGRKYLFYFCVLFFSPAVPRAINKAFQKSTNSLGRKAKQHVEADTCKRRVVALAITLK